MRFRLLVAACKVGLGDAAHPGRPPARVRRRPPERVRPRRERTRASRPTRSCSAAPFRSAATQVAYAAVARGADAYFKYVNSRGGVRGRQIKYRYVDDAYNPSETVRKTRELVQDDKVFAIFNSVGTEHVLAVRPYLNQVGVPQLFVGSGHSALALERKRYPWSMGYLPRFAGEGALYGRYLARTRPKAKIAVLHEDSRVRPGHVRGPPARARAALDARITAVQTYDLTDPDLNSQMARLKSVSAPTRS